MELSHPIADGIARPARRGTRTVRLTALVLFCAAAMAAFGAHAALATPSIVLTLSSSSVPTDGPVTMTVTVTSDGGVPSGTIGVFDNASTGPALATPALLPSGPNSAIAEATVTLPTKTYSVYALYTPDWPAFGIGLTAPMQTVPQTLIVGTVLPIPRPTQVILSAPADINSSEPVTLTATVREVPVGAIPAGTVQFTDTISGSPIRLGAGDVTLDSFGVAQLVVSLSAGAHKIEAAYSGGGIDSPSSSLPALVTSHPPPDVTVTTSTTVTIAPSPIASGDTVTITATIAQTGPGAPALPTGRVTFSSYSIYGDGVFIGEADLGVAHDGLTPAANQAMIKVSTLRPAEYSIVASYRGDIYDKTSGGALPLSVLPPRPGTAIDYTGGTTAVFGHLIVLSATITDLAHSPLAGRVLTFMLGTQTCQGTAGTDGRASCSLTMTQHPGDKSLSVSVPQDISTQAATINLNFTVTQQPTTISAVAQRAPGTTALTATLLGDLGPLDTQPVTLGLDGVTCPATTNAAGVATCSVPTIIGPLTGTLTASYGGTADYLPSADSHTIQLVLETSLTYSGALTSPYHGTPSLTAKLTDSTGAPVAGRTVTFTLGSQSCTATTNAAGVASCVFPTITQHPGPYTLAVHYAGDAFTFAADAAPSFAITPAPTTLTAATPPPGATSMTLSATLTETASGTPVGGKPVTLTLGLASCSATTSPAGLATCTVDTPSGATATLTALFAADVDYLGSSDTKTVTLLKPTVATYTGPTSGEYHDLVILSGTLANAGGAPLGAQPVTLKLGSQSCTATTSSTGKAWCLLLITQPAGTYSAGLGYAGNATYAPVIASAPFTISREDTALIANVGEALINGNSISLSAVLLEDYLFPIANRTVTLKLGPASCTDTTDALGYATCTVPRAAALGPQTFTATFAGDAYYLPSSVTRSTIVCAFPSGGAFVIGDREPGSVTFWSSQWSKQNKQSKGDAPSSFKGWASGNFDQSWGNNNRDGNNRNNGNNDDWSSDTGSSGSQPPGTLPTYMAVIQTSSSRKSGSRISGDTAHIVVVKTNAGYAPSAGHDGTGTVVATVR